MRRSAWIKLLLAVALAASTLGAAATAAIAADGRSPGAEPGTVTPTRTPATLFPVPKDGWDGDGPKPRDFVISDDLIVDGSACVGFDCVNGESFGFDTIRLKENNLRIHALDTSTSASFPSNDWQITFNETSNGGANKFSIDDLTGGRTPFTIIAGAPSNSLFVSSAGRVGIGTSTPTVNLHVKTGNTPTLRLEQDGTSGFTPQTWDVAGNEANFFIRDASNGSTLPFRIQPGAPSNALYIKAGAGDIGLGTTTPAAALHIRRTSSGAVQLRLDTDAENRRIIGIDNAGGQQTQVEFRNGGILRLLGATGSAGGAIQFGNGSGGAQPTAARGLLYVDADGTLCYSDGGAYVSLGGGNGACT